VKAEVQFSGLLSICAVGCRSLTRCPEPRPSLYSDGRARAFRWRCDVYRCFN